MGFLTKLAAFLEKGVYPASRRIGQIGIVAMMVMVLLVVAEVISRRLFNRPQAYSLELVQMMLVLVVFLTVAFTGTGKGHIGINILTSKFPAKSQAIINAINSILAVVVFAILSWRLVVYALMYQEVGRVTAVLRLPLYPFVFVMAFGSALLTLVIFIHLLNYIISASAKEASPLKEGASARMEESK